MAARGTVPQKACEDVTQRIRGAAEPYLSNTVEQFTHDVFISYSSNDKLVADMLCANLEARGVRCWIAPRDVMPGSEWGAAIIATAAVGALIYFILAKWELPLVITFAFIGWIISRFVRNRPRRLLKRFASRVKKIKEVRIIACSDREVTVVVDQALARTYVRINAQLDKLNARWYPGARFTVRTRDDLTGEELRALLQGPRVLHVRDDVLDERI